MQLPQITFRFARHTCARTLTGSTTRLGSAATPPVSARPSLVDTPSADFEAGLLFERFGAGNMGRLDALSFQKMWREREKLQQLRKALVPPNSGTIEQYIPCPVPSTVYTYRTP